MILFNAALNRYFGAAGQPGYDETGVSETTVCAAPGGPPTHFITASNRSRTLLNGATTCRSGQALPDALPLGSPTVGPVQTFAYLYEYDIGGGVKRYQHTRTVAWPAPLPAGVPMVPGMPAMEPEMVPWVPQWLDPLSAPIQQPTVAPSPPPYKAIPARRTNPWRSPSEQRQVGYSVPGVARNPAHWPGDVAPPVSFTPGRGTGLKPGPAHSWSPPPPGTKEPPKTRAESAVVGGLYAAMDAMTEGVEILMILHGALPKHLQAPYGSSAWEKAEAVWRNAGSIDMEKALSGIIANSIEDAIVGRAMRALRDSPGQQYTPRGTAKGPFMGIPGQ